MNAYKEVRVGPPGGPCRGPLPRGACSRLACNDVGSDTVPCSYGLAQRYADSGGHGNIPMENLPAVDRQEKKGEGKGKGKGKDTHR